MRINKSITNLYSRIDISLLPIYEYPTKKNIHLVFFEKLLSFVKLKKSKLSLLAFSKYLYYYFGALLFSLFSFFLYLLNVRFLLVDLSQIGSIHYLDLVIRENKSYRYIVFAANKYPLNNNYLISLYSKKILIIKNIYLRALILPLSIFSYLRVNTFRMDGCYQNTIAKEVHNKSIDLKPEPLIKMSSADKLASEKICDENKINLNKIVLLHIRDAGFYAESHNSLRNAKIETYKESVNYLSKKGYSVIRMGGSEAIDVSSWEAEIPGFIDYSRSKFANEKLDVYLFSHAAFYIGTSSGASSMAYLFLRPILMSNAFPADMCLGFSKNDLTIFKKFRYKDTNKLLALDKYFNELCGSNYGNGFIKLEDLNFFNIFIEDNNSNEILKSVKEIESSYNLDAVEPSEIQKEIKSFIKSSSYSYNSRANYSNSFIQGYHEEFIKK